MMKSKLILILFLLPICCSCAKPTCPKVYDELSRMEVYTTVDKEPVFDGEIIGVTTFLFKGFEKVKNPSHQNSFNFEFIVDTEGNVVAPRIYNKKEKDLTDAESFLIEKFKQMPKWTPGKCKEKIVPVLVIMPIRVNLRYD